MDSELLSKMAADKQPHPPEQNGRLYGRVIGWRQDRGFGFIARDDRDAWFHVKFVEGDELPRIGLPRLISAIRSGRQMAGAQCQDRGMTIFRGNLRSDHRRNVRRQDVGGSLSGKRTCTEDNL